MYVFPYFFVVIITKKPNFEYIRILKVICDFGVEYQNKDTVTQSRFNEVHTPL